MPKDAASLLRQAKALIISRWEKEVRQALEVARKKPHPILTNGLPFLLDDMASALEQTDPSAAQKSFERIGLRHGNQRTRLSGYTLEDLLNEYIILRRVSLGCLETENPLPVADRDFIVDAIEIAMKRSTERFVKNQMDEIRRLQGQAEKESAILNAIISSLPEALYIGDWTGIRRCNQLALDMLGFSSVDEMNHAVDHLSTVIQNRDPITKDPLPPSEIPFMKALAGQTSTKETLIHHLRSNEDRNILGRAAPVWHEGKIIGAVAINSDITELRRTEEDLHEAVGRLQREKEIREHFVMSLTHDLKNPLTVAKTNAQIIMLHPERQGLQHTLLVKIIESLERIERMVNDMLDANRIQAGQHVTLEMSGFDLSQLTRKVVDELVGVHGHRFQVSADGDLRGRWNESAIRRILENLLSNAIKYGDSARPITVTVKRAGDTALLKVHNYGAPISPDEIPNLFQPFRRTRSAEVSGAHGWGIGLTLVRGFTDAHQGKISVESSAESGTTFTVTLPMNAKGAKAEKAS